MAKKSVAHIVLSRVFSFVIFLVVLGIANYLIRYMPGYLYRNIIYFFNSNLLLLLVITSFGILAEIFWTLMFPFSLAAPIISAISGILIVNFIYKIWSFIETYAKTNFYLPINKIYVLVFVLVLIFGYILVFLKFLGHKEESAEKEKQQVKEKPKSEKIDWAEIGNEFKLIFYNIGRSINNLFEKDKKRK